MLDAPIHLTATARVLAAVSVTLLVGTACSHSSTGHSTSSATSHASSPAAAGGLPSGVRQDPAPTNYPNKPAARKYVTMTSCAQVAHGWSAGGTAANSGASKKTYAITIFFITSGGTVIGHASTTTTVDAGAKSKWTAKATFTPAPTTRCVLEGVA